jgi:hypothetical protein
LNEGQSKTFLTLRKNEVVTEVVQKGNNHTRNTHQVCLAE